MEQTIIAIEQGESKQVGAIASESAGPTNIVACTFNA